MTKKDLEGLLQTLREQYKELNKRKLELENGIVPLINTLETACIIVLANELSLDTKLYKTLSIALSDKVFDKARKTFLCNEMKVSE